MDDAYKHLLERQGYRFVGDHSAVKVCEWTKKGLNGEGTCYKQKFYGIASHQCVQMSPAVNFCGLGCVFCWRERNDSPFTIIDNPESVAEESFKAQKKLLQGFKAHKNISKKKWGEAMNPKHVAISLTGEPLAYPKINEMIAHLKPCSNFF